MGTDWTGELQSRVEAARACGVVHIAERARADLARAAVGEFAVISEPRGVADALARGLGFRALGPGWQELARGEARATLAAVLARNLAYETALMAEAEAYGLADEFLGRFGTGARFFTNGDLGTRAAGVPSAGWDPLTEATFDTGVVVVDADRAALFWFEDED
jgi:hypothetical protein